MRRRQRSLLVDIVFAVILLLALEAFLHSNIAEQVGKAAASGMRFGPTPAVTATP